MLHCDYLQRVIFIIFLALISSTSASPVEDHDESALRPAQSEPETEFTTTFSSLEETARRRPGDVEGDGTADGFDWRTWSLGRNDYDVWPGWADKFMKELIPALPSKDNRLSKDYSRLFSKGSLFRYNIDPKYRPYSGYHRVIVGFWAQEGTRVDEIEKTLREVLITDLSGQVMAFPPIHRSQAETIGREPYRGTQYYELTGTRRRLYLNSDSLSSAYRPGFLLTIQGTQL
ncbi:MAG: hypothetical protein M1837_003413 [Sclerophora amabilis]|nr:MAG: hypothetical protein M1837_003413 [Sclerophora amabilis]